MADVLNHGQIMRDNEIGQTMTLLQIFQRIQYLGLHRHIERGHWLIDDDELRIQGQCTRNTQPLALTT